MRVYFTVDTESSIGRAWDDPASRPLKADRHIFCRIGGQDYGIGLITNILAQRGFRATFFVETLAARVNGDEDTREVFDFLLRHDQDVQLHIHPVFRFYSEVRDPRGGPPSSLPGARTDLIGAYDEQRQLDLLGEASAVFRKFAGRDPSAFRAGCYGASQTTLRCLHRLGLLLDSSFNPCYPEWSFRHEALTPNKVCNLENIWEIPVAVARTPLPEGRIGLKMADPCSLSVTELRTMLQAAVAGGQGHFVIVFHSFSAVKPKDGEYREMRPDRIIIRRLEELMDYLAAHPDLYEVSTFGQLGEEIECLQDTCGFVPKLPLVAAMLRKSVQAVNRSYWL